MLLCVRLKYYNVKLRLVCGYILLVETFFSGEVPKGIFQITLSNRFHYKQAFACNFFQVNLEFEDGQ